MTLLNATLGALNLTHCITQRNNVKMGVAVDTFRVQNLIDEPLYDARRWNKVQKDLERVLRGEVSVRSLVESMTSPLFQKFSLSRRETRIRVDNEASDFYTVVESLHPRSAGASLSGYPEDF